jgi:hypothetical protein
LGQAVEAGAKHKLNRTEILVAGVLTNRHVVVDWAYKVATNLNLRSFYMQNNIKLSLLSLLVFFGSTAFAAAAAPVKNEKDMKAATNDPKLNTDASAAQAAVMYLQPPIQESNEQYVNALANIKPPQDVYDMAHAWLAGNPEIVAAALGKDPLFDTNLMGLQTRTLQCLQSAGCKNLSQSGYIFEPFPGWLMKISGHVLRRCNLHAADGTLPCNKPFEQSHWERVLKRVNECEDGYPLTYQHISRVAVLRLAQVAKEKSNLTAIDLPEKGLVHIPGRSKRVCDANYVVLVRKETGLTDADDISLVEFGQMMTMIQQTGFNDAIAENLKRKKGLMPVDLERRSCWAPNTFFYKPTVACPNSFDSDVKEGLKNMLALYNAQQSKKAQSATTAAK